MYPRVYPRVCLCVGVVSPSVFHCMCGWLSVRVSFIVSVYVSLSHCVQCVQCLSVCVWRHSHGKEVDFVWIINDLNEWRTNFTVQRGKWNHDELNLVLYGLESCVWLGVLVCVWLCVCLCVGHCVFVCVCLCQNVIVVMWQSHTYQMYPAAFCCSVCLCYC